MLGVAVTVADLLAKRVIFASEGKDRETWVQFVEVLEKHNGRRHAIAQASMDMSKAYQAGVAQIREWRWEEGKGGAPGRGELQRGLPRGAPCPAGWVAAKLS
ncbi:MAG: transposase [Verrucomicrobiota bacterium]